MARHAAPFHADSANRSAPLASCGGSRARDRRRWDALALAVSCVVRAEHSPLPRRRLSPPSSTARPSGPQSPPPSPRVFAFSLAPLRVRGGGDRPGLVIPDGTEIVALDLERGDSDARLDYARGVIRTLSGQEVWSGAASTGTLPAGIAARLEVPTGRLPADDYTITLISVDPSGREREDYVYFLRVGGR